MKYRSRIKIASVILEVANGGGVTKTRILTGAFLSYNQLQEYLVFLIQKDLVRYDKDTQTFDYRKGSKVSSNL